jgi:hypothetical protein
MNFFEIRAKYNKAWRAKEAAQSKYRNGRLSEQAWGKAVAKFNAVYKEYQQAFNALPLAREYE